MNNIKLLDRIYKKRIANVILSFAFSLLFICCSTAQNKISPDENIRWSEKLFSSFMKLHPDSIIYENELKSRKWNYEQGIIEEAFLRMWMLTNNPVYFNYAKKNVDFYVQQDGTILTYKSKDFNIDNIAPGRELLRLFEITKDEKYKIAADTLRAQLKNHPRNSKGGFWHKKIYPNQMWLDGLYMGEPFYIQYASMFNEQKSFDDIVNQFKLVKENLVDPKTGLYYHGWDESKVMKWAHPVKGTSPNFWGRSIGWFMMAIVDALDFLPEDHYGHKLLIDILNDLSESLLKYRDEKTKLWYQVVDKGELEGNYIETSGSLMFIYSYAKGFNKGYLDKKYFDIAKESFNSVLKNFVIIDEEGIINLNNVCSVSGLGGDPYRDGSFNYYINEPRRVNDFKGYGPLLLSAIEIEKNSFNSKIGKSKTVGLDYFYNNEWKDGKRFHYVWEEETFPGFSELGKTFSKFGAETISLQNAPTKNDLDKCSVYIIVDPDTPKETEKPNYMAQPEIDIIADWVNRGGILILMANDSGNCEFNNFNKLAEKFGIHFNEDRNNLVEGKKFEMGKFDQFPDHPLFNGVKKIYVKEISSLTLCDGAKPILARDKKIFMAGKEFGNGYVFAIGDPWLYNEYFDNRKLTSGFENYLAANNLVKWLLEKASTINKN